jgi:hypothetical protein
MCIRMQSFACAALLKAPDRVAGILELVEKDQRAALQEAIDQLKEIPEAEIRLRWKTLRQEAARKGRETMTKRIGLEMKSFPPRLQRWLARPF